jgi:hypothetical protein
MFRFTIRDVLWLTVVVAVGVGWWIDRRSLIRNSPHEYEHWWSVAAAMEGALKGEGYDIQHEGNLIVIGTSSAPRSYVYEIVPRRPEKPAAGNGP